MINKYYYLKNQDSGICAELCPTSLHTKIGSLGCQSCVYNLGYDNIKQWVKCMKLVNIMI